VEAGRLQTLARQVTPSNVMEVRLELEPALAALAAQRAARDELATLRRSMIATLEAGDPAAYDAADEVFHFKIAELAHNPLFLMIYQSIREVRRHAGWTDRRREMLSPDRIARLADQHRCLFADIAGRRPEFAARGMEEHLIAVSTLMLRPRPSARVGLEPAGSGGESR
jgi:DNA-binding FadR family transcriptional regulator